MAIIQSDQITVKPGKPNTTLQTFLTDFLPHITPGMVKNILAMNDTTDDDVSAIYAKHQEELKKKEAKNLEKQQDGTQV